MKLAPMAVFGAITAVVAKEGLGIISTYATFIGEFYFSLTLLWAIIIGRQFYGIKERAFRLLNNIKDAILVAFSTSTSEAAYPRALEELEDFGCNNKIVSFVLPLGYSFNLVGSMMYMTFASLIFGTGIRYPPFFRAPVVDAFDTDADEQGYCRCTACSPGGGRRYNRDV